MDKENEEFLELLAGTPPKDKRRSCYYADWLSTFSPAVQDGIESAVRNHKWKTTDLYALLKTKGYERLYDNFRTHRVGQCSCAA